MVVSDLFAELEAESYRRRPSCRPFIEPRRGGAVLYGLAFAHLDYSEEVLSALTLGFAAGAAILRAFVVPAWWYEFMYRGTLTRMDGLALGAFIAIAVRTPRLRAILHRLLPFALLVALAIVVSAFAMQGNFQWNRPMQLYGATGLASFFCLLVFWCVDSRPASMRNGFLRSFARYAYAIYVFHSPLNQILIPWLDPVWRRFPPALDLFLRCLYIIAMTAVAWGLARLSWTYFEEPVNRLKLRFPYRSDIRQPGYASQVRVVSNGSAAVD
jgi:peptidoglycan/LPS O-acetylase OafA/YrhL